MSLIFIHFLYLRSYNFIKFIIIKIYNDILKIENKDIQLDLNKLIEN